MARTDIARPAVFRPGAPGEGLEVISLANGLRIVLDPMPGLESTALGMWIQAGARDEAAPINGVAHLFEHMAFKGAGTRDARAFAEAMLVSPRRTSRLICSGLKTRGMPGSILASSRTWIVRSRMRVLGADATRVLPPKPVTWQNML